MTNKFLSTGAFIAVASAHTNFSDDQIKIIKHFPKSESYHGKGEVNKSELVYHWQP